MAVSILDLCNRALLKIGVDAIGSFDEGTAQSEVAVNLYPGILDGLLSAYPWSFATDQVRLAQLSQNDFQEFEFAYQLPNNFLRALTLSIGYGAGGTPYRIRQDQLCCDAQGVLLTYIFRPEIGVLPAFFVQPLVLFLAAEFCLPLTESATRAESLFKMAEKEERKARNIDAQQQTAVQMDLNSLIRVRG